MRPTLDRMAVERTPALVEVADRCWLSRHPFLDVNVGVVAGQRGLLLVDTLFSGRAAGALLDELPGLGAGEVVAAVNTHAHFDHCLGNAELAGRHPAATLVAHEEAARSVRDDPEQLRADGLAHAGTQDRRDEIAASGVLAATQSFSSARAIDLGDRLVEVIHPGRGHTSGDAVVLVPDADVLYAGDLVEESGPPGYGADCFPLAWPATLDLVTGLVRKDTVVVPGHGAPVDQRFVVEQRGDVGQVAETIRDLAGRGVPESVALGAGDWPFPVEALTHAVARGYAHLPRSARSLPLL
jgi:glyoxylase-like metal-dependent hydrolase (beta-lactamase superfamily II)